MKRVLVADDTKNIRVLLTKCLELDGYSVLTATDGQEALDLFNQNKFDLAFLDIKMPQFSGTEVLRRLREQGITTPVIIITAYATIKNAVECTQMGAVAYLQKPFTAEKVRSVLDELNIAPYKGIGYIKDEIQINQIEDYLKQGLFSKAIELLKTAISIDPANPYIYLLFSKAYQGLDDLSNANRFEKIYETFREI